MEKTLSDELIELNEYGVDLPRGEFNKFVSEVHIKQAVRELNNIKIEIFKELEKPIDAKLDLLAFKIWLIGKFDEIDKIFGDKLNENIK